MRGLQASRLAVSLILLAAVACSSPDLRLHPVANEGVLLASGDRKVLVDALFDRPNPAYRAPSRAELAKMMSERPPYDGIDLVLVTHGHSDHFDAPLAARYLAAVPHPVLLAPADAVAALRRTREWRAIAPRVVPLDLKPGATDRRDVGGIAVTSLRTLHSGNRDSPMNLAYIVETNGWRVYHEGDSPADTTLCEAFALGEPAVDVALVQHWRGQTLGSPLLLALQASHVGLMHLGVDYEPHAAQIWKTASEAYGNVFLLMPGMEDAVFSRDVPRAATAHGSSG